MPQIPDTNEYKTYTRVLLGQKNMYAEECLKANFIGVDFDIDIDLTGRLPEHYKDFNKEFIPLYLAKHPDKAKAVAGLAGGFTHTVCRYIEKGDIVLCPTGKGTYLVGEITGPYYFAPGQILPHRRPVRWLTKTIEKTSMSQALQRSTSSSGTVSSIDQYGDEIESLIKNINSHSLTTTESTVADLVEFEFEKHLEDFLVKNWKQTELGKNYDLFEEDKEMIGQQFPTDTGPIDILAISKDKKELLVVELKRGRVSDTVVGQIQRYMGYIKEEIAEENQIVKGVIIALEDDKRIRRALAVTSNIEFYRYQVSFKLFKN